MVVLMLYLQITWTGHRGVEGDQGPSQILNLGKWNHSETKINYFLIYIKFLQYSLRWYLLYISSDRMDAILDSSNLTSKHEMTFDCSHCAVNHDPSLRQQIICRKCFPNCYFYLLICVNQCVQTKVITHCLSCSHCIWC